MKPYEPDSRRVYQKDQTEQEASVNLQWDVIPRAVKYLQNRHNRIIFIRDKMEGWFSENKFISE